MTIVSPVVVLLTQYSPSISMYPHLKHQAKCIYISGACMPVGLVKKIWFHREQIGDTSFTESAVSETLQAEEYAVAVLV